MTACCVCGSTEASPWRSSSDALLGGATLFHAVRCRRCGTVRLDPRPPAGEMGRYYAPQTYARAEDAGACEVGKRLDAYNARVAERADALAAPEGPRRVLDVGCGDGRFLKAMAERGWDVSGTETDPVAADLARRRTGATVYGDSLEELSLPDGGFDLVTMLHVLEHVPDPVATLASVRRLLRPGGSVLIAVPNAGSVESFVFGNAWYHLDLPRHLWGFTPRTLTRLLETSGFAVSRPVYLPFLFAPQSLLRRLRMLRRRSGGSGGAGGGGAWQTALFLRLLDLSERLGRRFPGEIMEVSAMRAEGVNE